MDSRRHARTSDSLERLLAENVLRALVDKQHLRVAGTSHDALCDDLAAGVQPLLASVTPYLMAAHASLRVTETSFGDRDVDEALAVMADGIGERLAHSNHVDDIFVDDSTLRRTSLRAARLVFLRYMRGELAVVEDEADGEGFVISLDELGYLVSTVASRIEASTLERTLVNAGSHGGATFVGYDAGRRIATFSPVHAEPDLIAIDESITASLRTLVASGEVELPKVEQEFEVPRLRLGRGGLAGALREAERSFNRRGHTSARCERISPRRIRLAVTPVTRESAQQADVQFEELVALVEAAMDVQASAPDSQPPESAAAESRVQRRKPGTKSSQKASQPKSAPSKAVGGTRGRRRA